MSNESYGKINQATSKILHSPFLKTTGIYTFANFANASIPFFLMPILTRYLTPLDYGITAIFGVIVAICNPFISLNTQTAISIKYFKIAKNEFPKYVSSSLMITIVSCLTMLVLFVLFSRQIEKATNFPADWLWAVIVVCFSGNIIGTLLIIFQSQVKSYHYATIQFTQTILNMGITIWFVVWLGMNWQGRISAQVIAVAITAIASIILLYKNGCLVFKYNREYVTDAIKIGLPLVPNNIVQFLIFAADRFIIAILIGLSEVGIYSVGVQFSLIIGYTMDSFQRAYSPWLFSKLSNATAQVKSQIVLMTYGYIIFILFFAIINFYFLPVIIKFFVSENFYGAVSIIFWAISARVFWSLSENFGNYINYTERTSILLWLNLPLSFIHLILCYLLVKENGIAGAAQANTLTCFMRFLAVWCLSTKVYPMPWVSFYKNMF